EPGSGRLVHLAEYHHGLVDDARFLHLQPEVVPFARPLPHAREDRETAVLRGDVPDQLLQYDRLPEAGAAEETDLSTLGVGGEQVDDFDPGLENPRHGLLLFERGWSAVDRKLELRLLHGGALIDGLPEEVEHAAERLSSDGHLDRAARVDRLHIADESVGGGHRDATNHLIADMERHLDREADVLLGV